MDAIQTLLHHMHELWLNHADLILWFFGLVGLILLSGFFSISETGMMALNRYRLRHHARMGHPAAVRTQKLLERPDRLLGVVLIGNTFANIFASSIATYIAVRLFGDIGIIIATFILTFVILIFSEMAPKTLAALHPQQVAFLVSLPLRLLLTLLYPIVWLANGMANGVLFLFGIKVKKKHVAERLNAEELRTVVHESVEHEDQKRLSVRHKDMLLGVLDLSHVTVEDVMFPRNEIIGIDLQLNLDEILRIITSTTHTRFPVYYGSIDKVSGILNLRDVTKLIVQNRLTHKAIIKSLREPYFIPEGTSLHTQLHEFRKNKRRLALVVDEYGDIIGLVTLENILEEIVGELDIDSASMRSLVKAEDENSFIIDGTVSIRDLNKYLQWSLPVDGPKTISGLITEWLETIPSDVVCLQIGNYRLEVLAISEHRILQVRIEQVKLQK